MRIQRPHPVPQQRSLVGRGVALLGISLLLLGSAACGGGGGADDALPGTVAVLNQSDLGMAPLVVEQFFLEPVAGGATGNRLRTTIPPGGVVILGLFPAGLYNASAVLEGGGSINWLNEEVRPGEPKNFVIP